MKSKFSVLLNDLTSKNGPYKLKQRQVAEFLKKNEATISRLKHEESDPSDSLYLAALLLPRLIDLRNMLAHRKAEKPLLSSKNDVLGLINDQDHPAISMLLEILEIHSQLIWPNEQARQKAVLLAQSAGIDLEAFLMECAVRYGTWTRRDLREEQEITRQHEDMGKVSERVLSRAEDQASLKAKGKK